MSVSRKTTITITDRKTCDKLIAMIGTGHARIVKEIIEGNADYLVFSQSGTQIGIIGKKWKYLFAKLLGECGAGDDLFPGCDQTIEWRK